LQILRCACLRVLFLTTANKKACFFIASMPIAVALWSVYKYFILARFQAQRYVRSTVVKPGQPLSVIPQSDLVITNAALGVELADSAGRTSVKLTYVRPVKVTGDDEDDEEKDGEDDEDASVETVLCSLTPGKVLNTVSWHFDSRD
jgi:nucleoplasmin-like protein